METPNLRLLLLAYFRGLLKPDYECGTKSRVREILVLRGLARELEADALVHKAKLDASMLPVMKPEAWPDLLNGLIVDYHKGVAFKSHASAGVLRKIHQARRASATSAREMAAAMKVLKKTDFMDKMDKVLAAAFK